MYFIHLVVLAFLALPVFSKSLSVATPDDTKESAKVLAGRLMEYVDPGTKLLRQPYWWWQSATAYTALLAYGHLTGDPTYDTVIASSITAQAASGNFMGPHTTGNDDQIWWALLSMTAAEYNTPSTSPGTDWLRLAQNVYEQISTRWDPSTCQGGLGWQIQPSADGYHYKNAISNGLFFQLSARLAAFTNDPKYSDMAKRILEWVQSVGMIEKSSSRVFDGTDALKGCIDLNHDEWSYNVGVFMYGSAVMLKHTGDTAYWQPLVDGFVSAAATSFTQNNILQESKCEHDNSCNTDQLSFKASLARWLAQTAILAPSTIGRTRPILQASADGALSSCNAGPNQSTCGLKWTQKSYDSSTGAGQTLSALEIVQWQLALNQPVANGKRTVPILFNA